MKSPAMPNTTRGFSLLEIAVVLVIVGLMVGLVAQTRKAVEPTGCYVSTKAQLATIRDAMASFVRTNNRYPIPAGRSFGVRDAKFGREAFVRVSTATAPELATVDRANSLIYGALPFQALGLPESFGADCWGNKFSYVVTEAMTTADGVGGYPDGTIKGLITLKSSAAVTVADPGASSGMDYVVVSHGENGATVGAVARNYTTAAHAWCAVAAAADTENCDLSNATFHVFPFNNGKDAGALYFDDMLVYSGKAGTPGCTAQAFNWTVGADNCSGTTSALADGATEVINDAGAPTTGSATARCTAGVISEDPGSTCSVPPPCGAQVVNWSDGGNNCTETSAVIAEGAGAWLGDATGPDTGWVYLQCSAGVLVPSSPSCVNTPPPTCAAQAVNWNVGGQNCASTTVGTMNEGDIQALTHTADPAKGGVSVQCLSGSLVQSGATCKAECSGPTTWYNDPMTKMCTQTLSPAVYVGDPVALTDSTPVAVGTLTGTCTGAGIITVPPGGNVCDDAPYDCPAQAHSWTDSDTGYTCTYSSTPGLYNGQFANLDDTIKSTVGSKFVTCTAGALTGGAGTCNYEPDCGSTNAWWGPGSACNNTGTGPVLEGDFINIPHADGGWAMICVEGNYTNSMITGATQMRCDPAPTSCAAQVYSWGAGCSGDAAFATAENEVFTIFDVTDNGALGTVEVRCTGGALVPTGVITQCGPTSCPSQMVNWTEGGNTCTGKLRAQIEGGGQFVQDRSDPVWGQGQFYCSGGVPIYSGGGTCAPWP